ncbi:Ubiquitin carboxyl-terminal hydrolase MINDY-1, partial [Geodia barretti]
PSGACLYRDVYSHLCEWGRTVNAVLRALCVVRFCLMSETTTEGEKPDCGGGGGESRDLGPMATPVDGDAATVDGDGGRETTPADSTSIYQLKWVEWKGGFVPVITQNENGPCPLLALCNVLLLTDRMKLVAGETVVTSTALMDLLGTAIIENMPQVSIYLQSTPRGDPLV